MNSMPFTWSVSCWKIRASRSSPTSEMGRPWRSWPHPSSLGPGRGIPQPADRQTALLLDLLALELREHRVRHRSRSVAVVGVEDEEPKRQPDLWRGQSHAWRVIHRLEHVLVQPHHQLVEDLDVAAGLAQHGVAELADGQVGHALTAGQVLSSQLGLGLDPVHDSGAGQPSDLVPEPVESGRGDGHQA